MLENLTFVPPPPPMAPAPGSASLPPLGLDVALGMIGDAAPLRVNGSADLAGNLSVSLSTGFTPQLGDSLPVLTALGGITGAFDDVVLPQLGNGLAWDIAYSAVSLALDVVPALLGDYDFNGMIDALDYTVWRDSLGQTGRGLRADGNRDQVVDHRDFELWQSRFAQGGPIGVSAIPEPTCWGGGGRPSFSWPWLVDEPSLRA